jgi:hypothetical protein
MIKKTSWKVKDRLREMEKHCGNIQQFDKLPKIGVSAICQMVFFGKNNNSK